MGQCVIYWRIQVVPAIWTTLYFHRNSLEVKQKPIPLYNGVAFLYSDGIILGFQKELHVQNGTMTGQIWRDIIRQGFLWERIFSLYVWQQPSSPFNNCRQISRRIGYHPFSMACYSPDLNMYSYVLFLVYSLQHGITHIGTFQKFAYHWLKN